MKTLNLLLPATHAAYALRQVRWALSLETESACRPIVLSTLGKDLTDIYTAKGLTAPAHLIHPPSGLGWRTKDDRNEVRKNKSGMITRRREMARRIPGLTDFYDFIKSLRLLYKGLQRDRKRIDYIRSIIREHNIDAVMVVETSVPYESPLFIRAARLEGIPSISSPTGRDCPLAYAGMYKTDKELTKSTLLKFIIGLVAPQWIYKYQGLKILRISDYEVLKQILLKTASPEPWHAIGQIEDFVFTQSKVDADYYIELGAPAHKFKNVGAPEYDQLKHSLDRQKELRDGVCAELGLDQSKPILLTSLVQGHWVSGRSEAEFQNNEDLIQAWLAPLYEQTKFCVIVSLHPSHNFEELEKIQTPNLKISKRDVTQLISFCDLFVTCMSSITPMAIAAGKPILNYDTYRYTLEFPGFGFDRANGVVTVTRFEDYREQVLKFANEDEYLSQTRKKQATSASLWGALDGLSTQRLVEELKRGRE